MLITMLLYSPMAKVQYLTVAGVLFISLASVFIWTFCVPSAKDIPDTHMVAPEPRLEVPTGVERYMLQIATEYDIRQMISLELNNGSRILCLILTTEYTIDSRAQAVNSTWGKRCNKHFFILKTRRRSPDIINTPFEENRKSIVHKVKFALSYIYEHHINDFDWLLKADDDTYVILENLKHLLRKHDSSQPCYLGFHFNKFVANGYMSGGAGYVMSNRALRKLVETGFYPGSCPVIPNSEDPENSEDIEIGRCLNKTGVPVISSLDDEGRETFHPYPLERHLMGSVPQFVFDWAKNPQKSGAECCSRYSISFHYIEPSAMLVLDHLLYRTSVTGLEHRDAT